MAAGGIAVGDLRMPLVPAKSGTQITYSDCVIARQRVRAKRGPMINSGGIQ